MYKATCIVKNRTYVVTANSFDKLTGKMDAFSSDKRFSTNGENSKSGWDMVSVDGEPWCKDMIYPRIEWNIEKLK